MRVSRFPAMIVRDVRFGIKGRPWWVVVLGGGGLREVWGSSGRVQPAKSMRLSARRCPSLTGEIQIFVNKCLQPLLYGKTFHRPSKTSIHHVRTGCQSVERSPDRSPSICRALLNVGGTLSYIFCNGISSHCKRKYGV